MARLANKLTAAAVAAAKPLEKQYTLPVGSASSLLVKPNGARLWRFRYRVHGVAKMISLGGYPDTGLGLARDKLADARKLLAAGVDPSAKRKAERRARPANRYPCLAHKCQAASFLKTSLTSVI